MVMRGPKRRRRVARALGIILGVYALLAVLPYAFPPEAERAQAAFVPMEDGASGDRATILTTGEQALAARLNLIANAETSLIVGSYLYADDESGYTVAAALLDAADRGVQVRIVVDGLVGRFNFWGGDLGYALGTHPNIELRYYNDLNLLAPWGLSARYHEKYVIADGRAFVLGGRNISDEFLTEEEHPAYNYDLDVLMWRESPAQGSAAAALTAYFDRLWDEECVTACERAPAWREAGVSRTADELRSRWEAMETEYAQAIAPADWGSTQFKSTTKGRPVPRSSSTTRSSASSYSSRGMSLMLPSVVTTRPMVECSVMTFLVPISAAMLKGMGSSNQGVRTILGWSSSM